MRQLAGELAGNDDSPVTQARRFYDWIGEHIQYSFAREYSTILNLGDYCLAHRYGDCGQEALLFITLCRLRGIPARWQAGWTIFPGAENLHDWCEIHLAPYGWVPVDPYMGIYAARYSAGLDAAQRQELRDFYFGGLSQYRLIANSDHCQALEPPKRTFRSDTVDFQRGEVETSTRNLYFGEWKYGLRWKEVPTTPPRASGPAPPAGPPLAPP
jgi:transglutaminase-like putative cysteine protease